MTNHRSERVDWVVSETFFYFIFCVVLLQLGCTVRIHITIGIGIEFESTPRTCFSKKKMKNKTESRDADWKEYSTRLHGKYQIQVAFRFEDHFGFL